MEFKAEDIENNTQEMDMNYTGEDDTEMMTREEQELAEFEKVREMNASLKRTCLLYAARFIAVAYITLGALEFPLEEDRVAKYFDLMNGCIGFIGLAVLMLPEQFYKLVFVYAGFSYSLFGASVAYDAFVVTSVELKHCKLDHAAENCVRDYIIRRCVGIFSVMVVAILGLIVTVSLGMAQRKKVLEDEAKVEVEEIEEYERSNRATMMV